MIAVASARRRIVSRGLTLIENLIWGRVLEGRSGASSTRSMKALFTSGGSGVIVPWFMFTILSTV